MCNILTKFLYYTKYSCTFVNVKIDRRFDFVRATQHTIHDVVKFKGFASTRVSNPVSPRVSTASMCMYIIYVSVLLVRSLLINVGLYYIARRNENKTTNRGDL